VDTVLVTGGTGHLGRDVVSVLKDRCQVRVLARTPGQDPVVQGVRGDLDTGAGITEAVAGAQGHRPRGNVLAGGAPRFPPADRLSRSPPHVDVEGTNRLLAAAKTAAVGHFLYVSIVGVERTPLPYARLKLVKPSPRWLGR